MQRLLLRLVVEDHIRTCVKDHIQLKLKSGLQLKSDGGACNQRIMSTFASQRVIFGTSSS